MLASPSVSPCASHCVCSECEMFSYSLAFFSDSNRKGSLFMALEARPNELEARFHILSCMEFHQLARTRLMLRSCSAWLQLADPQQKPSSRLPRAAGWQFAGSIAQTKGLQCTPSHFLWFPPTQRHTWWEANSSNWWPCFAFCLFCVVNMPISPWSRLLQEFLHLWRCWVTNGGVGSQMGGHLTTRRMRQRSPWCNHTFNAAEAFGDRCVPLHFTLLSRCADKAIGARSPLWCYLPPLPESLMVDLHTWFNRFWTHVAGDGSSCWTGRDMAWGSDCGFPADIFWTRNSCRLSTEHKLGGAVVLGVEGTVRK